MISSVIYLFSLFCFFGVFFFVKKDKCTHHSGMAWIVIHAAILMWINVFIAGIFGVFNISYTLTSVAMVYILLTVLGIKHIKNNGIQKYTWRISDFIFELCIFVVAVCVGLRIHTSRLLIADASGDTCMHYRYALKVANTGVVKGEMFFAPVNNGLFISLLKPFLKEYQYYKAFIAMGIMMLALSGCVMYAILSDIIQDYKTGFFALIAALLYMLGYPLHNELMGFVYLGMSVTIVSVLFYLFRLFRKNILDKKWAILLMMLGCFSLVMCYMLFAPVVYFALFISLMIYCLKKRGFVQFVKWALQIFLIPCILAVYYCYFNFFKNRDLAISNAISTNGGTRGKLYSYILILLPLTVYLCVSDYKRKRNYEIKVLFYFVIACVVGTIILVFYDKFSLYYYTKFLYLLWYILFIANCYGLIYMRTHEHKSFVSYVVMLSVMGCVFIANFNGKFDAKANVSGYGHLAENYRTISFGIYNENMQLIKDTVGPYDSEKIKLYRYIDENLKGAEVPVLGDLPNYLDVYWCENFTGQNLEKYYYWTGEAADSIDKILNQGGTPYVLILYGTEFYENNKDTFERFDKEYETRSGCIYKINNR